MRTIKEVFAYCRAVHGKDKQQCVTRLNPSAVATVWDHGDFGMGMGVVGATIHDRPAALICFQGTKGTIKDWWRNFKVKEDDRTGVDEGFQEEWMQYRDEVGSWTSKLDSNVDIYTTGHSQGGPCAAQSSEFLWDQFCRKSSCIPFGCPQWCNKDARNRYDILPVNLTNVINPMDLVTRVDPKAERPGKEFELRNEWWHRLFPWFWIVEHTLDQYQSAIERTEKILGRD
jgi:hypothetical protein